MESGDVIEVARDALMTLLLTAGPILAVGLGVGLTVAFIQALTQLQEMTLTFVPKIIAVFAVLLLAMPYMGQNMSALMLRISERIISGG
ncbi:flagellar biosynthesis protein FliQ [Kordiimonas lacus]|uniref:Flagellar biosynthetic protein FliQ n=1 Tax=Kordiimonas lacus TaxID=637679 RepID=A0A1G7CPS5_9PROT|nr:flagellar biosynthesis protein FliQ [Kordiimonas lacus]SDE40656.1 flagellar biosynthetic protein FliQ [Kordiimonas lacus]